MRQLVLACALVALAGCGGVAVEARGPDGITISRLFSKMQDVEDEAVKHCQRTGRRARFVGMVLTSGNPAYRYECQ